MYSSDKGQSLIENAVIWGIIVIVSIGILTTFGSTIKDMLYQTKEEYRSFQPFKAPADASITPGKPWAPDPDTPGDGLLPGEGTVIGADAPLPPGGNGADPTNIEIDGNIDTNDDNSSTNEDLSYDSNDSDDNKDSYDDTLPGEGDPIPFSVQSN
ncbi:MAG: hypothetical protein AB1782_12065 [Cyanobacteriota bacterium]